MEHRRSLISTAEALHRVFLAGTLRRPLFHTRLPHPPQRQQKRTAVFASKRFTAGQGAAPIAGTSRPLDENINAREVHLVSPEGRLQPAQPLSTILASFDRKDYFLVQYSPRDADQIPVCKIVKKETFRAAERAKLKPPKNAQTTTKQLELGWAIGGNDLGHRLKKLEEFLEEGRRVEVVLATKTTKKKTGRVASKEEAEALVKNIRAKIKEVEGAREWKEAEGAVGTQMTLYFKGTKKK